MKRNQRTVPIELPIVVRIRFRVSDHERLVALARTGRRTLSQTIRLLLEPALVDGSSQAGRV